ncbi:hypothetical protein EGJ86_19320 [Pseudomonas sp. o96-267]|uniref:hypothetical protein n=1 Tax=Pseudomonas sp. o96-267 TaxID=2479853 RepID=UPI000F76B2DC|nr:MULTISPECIES: hypothetical protein [Pseudomonas]MDH0959081.1 hypothetical protein [Pseudomonas chengduensis]MDV5863611.1 hypothetical protein [Pseudomonas mendocina]RRV31723.1 hypothetical protein EGJ86_19320 [Pseudomonas sp. o96-267]
MQQELKAFQVGDHDIVAHYSAAEALAYLCEQYNYSDGEVTIDETSAVSDKLLDEPMRDEEGNTLPPLRVDLVAATAPAILHSWE